MPEWVSISGEDLKKQESKRTRLKRTVNYNEDTNSEDEKDWILPEEETEKYQPFHSEVKNNHLFNYIF